MTLQFGRKTKRQRGGHFRDSFPGEKKKKHIRRELAEMLHLRIELMMRKMTNDKNKPQKIKTRSSLIWLEQVYRR